MPEIRDPFHSKSVLTKGLVLYYLLQVLLWLLKDLFLCFCFLLALLWPWLRPLLSCSLSLLKDCLLRRCSRLELLWWGLLLFVDCFLWECFSFLHFSSSLLRPLPCRFFSVFSLLWWLCVSLCERLFPLIGSLLHLPCSGSKSFLYAFCSWSGALLCCWFGGIQERTPELFSPETATLLLILASLMWISSWIFPFKYFGCEIILSLTVMLFWQSWTGLAKMDGAEVDVMQWSTLLGGSDGEVWGALDSIFVRWVTSVFLCMRLLSSFSLNSFSFLCSPSALSFSSSTRRSSAACTFLLSSNCWRRTFSSLCSCSKSFNA